MTIQEEYAQLSEDMIELHKIAHARAMQIVALEKVIGEAGNVVGWAQAVLTALNVGDVKSGSPLHLKLREVMIAYRKALLPFEEGAEK